MKAMTLATRLVIGAAAALCGLGLSRGDDTMAVLAGVVVWFALVSYRAEYWALATRHRNTLLEARCAALEAQDLWRQQEYDRLVAEARSKMGQAEMIIRGTRR